MLKLFLKWQVARTIGKIKCKNTQKSEKIRGGGDEKTVKTEKKAKKYENY